MNIRDFLVGMILVSLTTTVFIMWMGGGAAQYGVNYDSDTNATLLALDKLEVVQNDTQDINDQLFSNESQSDGTLELVGKFLGSGIQTLKLAKNSFSAFYDMSEAAFGVSYLGDTLAPFKTAAITIVMILIVFIILSVVVGREV